jgi:hypothetical protein
MTRTDQAAYAKTAQYPHISPETNAYYVGRDAGEFGGECGYSVPSLVSAWQRGVRSVRAEMRLNIDAEWD